MTNSEKNTDSDDEAVCFATMDFTGVNFDDDGTALDASTPFLPSNLDEILAMFGTDLSILDDKSIVPSSWITPAMKWILTGDYERVLAMNIPSIMKFMKKDDQDDDENGNVSFYERVSNAIRLKLLASASDEELLLRDIIDVLLCGIASFNLFLQCNYTGPAIGKGELLDMEQLFEFHVNPFAELSADGELCCSIVECPMMLLFARVVFHTLATPNRMDWSHSIQIRDGDDTRRNGALTEEDLTNNSSSLSSCISMGAHIENIINSMCCVKVWNARAATAQQRLLHVRTLEPCPTLWNETKQLYDSIFELIENCSDEDNHYSRSILSRIYLEYGLAMHHFEYRDKGKACFVKAKELSGLRTELTGAMGKRTKYQQEGKAQLLVRASSNAVGALGTTTNDDINEQNNHCLPEHIKFDDQSHLLERTQYESKDDDEAYEQLNPHHQTILLSLCLDAKNDNPLDELTTEVMLAYLQRTLLQHDDWMVYATSLLERAWIEFEHSSNKRERALLQMQALVDQHSTRLGITQSTVQAAVQDSAPVQQRMRHIHSLIYPPHWSMLAHLATRYASLGIVTSAAEMFAQVEMWDDVVDCYRRAGKEGMAEQTVRAQLDLGRDTPRMWAALGDLTNDISYYEKALNLSNYKYADAYFKLGRYYFDNNQNQKSINDHDLLKMSEELIRKGLKLKPLKPQLWFLLGTICMRRKNWDGALKAFSEVVQQEPTEGDAWANVAAVHMKQLRPQKAYPALVESLKQFRSNWKVWQSKLYVCIDLQKYDEAIQACHELMRFGSKLSKDDIGQQPLIEEKCVRGIVGGVLKQFECALKSAEDDDADIDSNGTDESSTAAKAKLDSATRSVRRLSDMLNALSTTLDEHWIYEIISFFHARIGQKPEEILKHLQKHYRSLQANYNDNWELNVHALEKFQKVALDMADAYDQIGDQSSLIKCRFMLNGLIKRVRKALDGYSDEKCVVNVEEIVRALENRLDQINDKL